MLVTGNQAGSQERQHHAQAVTAVRSMSRKAELTMVSSRLRSTKAAAENRPEDQSSRKTP